MTVLVHIILFFGNHRIMNILFLGNSFPPSVFASFTKDCKGRGSFAQHNYERSMMTGLSQQAKVTAKALLVPWVGTFPISYSRLFTNREEFELNGMPIRSIGFCNLAILNGFSRRNRLVKELLRSFDEFEGETIHVLIVTYKYDIMVALDEAKRRTKKRITQTVNMIDMPGFEFESRIDISEWRKKILRKKLNTTMRLVKNSDGVVVMTSFFLDFFDRPIPHVIVEGMIDEEGIVGDDIIGQVKCRNKQVVLYTGTLKKIYGVMNLVNAFEAANVEDSELWICGTGEAEADIKERGLSNPNIKYLGLLTSAESWQKQREATVLVNPRTSEGEYTKYSFPSKNFEYLLSGRPVIFNRLPGIPDEYFQYAIAPENESVEALAECLKKMLLLPEEERIIIGNKGRRFISETKSAKCQVAKIMNLINTY